jgi:hypothetical protein
MAPACFLDFGFGFSTNDQLAQDITGLSTSNYLVIVLLLLLQDPANKPSV